MGMFIFSAVVPEGYPVTHDGVGKPPTD